MVICDAIVWLLSSIFSGFVLEIIIYAIVDKSTKDRLRVAKTDLEKQKVWLKECLSLSIISFITWFHHIPYFLLAMIFCTISVIATASKTGLGSWFKWIIDYYKDFREHEESITKLKKKNEMEKIRLGPQISHPYRPWPASAVVPQPTSVLNKSPLKIKNCGGEDDFENMPPPNVTLIQQTGNGGSSITKFAPDVVQPNHHMPPTSAAVFQSNNQLHFKENKKTDNSVLPFSPTSWLTSLYKSVRPRPPLHPKITNEDSSNNVQFTNQYKSIPNKFQDVIRAKPEVNQIPDPHDTPNNNIFPKRFPPIVDPRQLFQPRGLVNKKENLCFFNSVIQVLARTEKLVMELIRISGHLRTEDPVLTEIINVFATLTNPDPHLNNPLVCPPKPPVPIDTTKLRRALLSESRNGKSLIGVPAAEYKTNSSGNVLIDRIHNFITGRPTCSSTAATTTTSTTTTTKAMMVGGGACLLQMPGCGRQTEQDVAEMFMWLVEKMNRVVGDMEEARELHNRSEYQTKYLNLRAKYGNPSTGTIAQLKEFHQQQLKPKGGSIGPPLTQRHEVAIADLDWLLYKQPTTTTVDHRRRHHQSPTVIDDLFTGQLSFSTFCNRCYGVSITTDVFKILPVAVPTELGMCVSIEQCLRHLTSIDQVSGSESMICQFCACATEAATTTATRSSTPIIGIPQNATVKGGVTTSTPNGGMSVKLKSQSVGDVGGMVVSSPKDGRGMVQELGTQSLLNFLSPIRKDNGGVNFMGGPPTPNLFSSTPPPPLAFPTCSRQTIVTRIPDYLIIQLMKFQVANPSANPTTTTTTPSKHLTRVVLSSEPINFESLLAYNGGISGGTRVVDGGGGVGGGPRGVLHQLYAVILHSSKNESVTSDGHYIALVRTNKTTWHMFDDEQVTYVKDVEGLLRKVCVQQNAYLLFYCKVA